MRRARITLLLLVVCTSWTVAARGDRAGWFRSYRNAVRAASAAGFRRAERRAVGDELRRAAQQSSAADRKDLRRVLDDPALGVSRGPGGVSLEGGGYRVTLQAGRLALQSRDLQWSATDEWGFRGGSYTKLRSGHFRLEKSGIAARDTRTGEDTRLTYSVWGVAAEDRRDPRRLMVIDPTVEPVGQAHTYRFKPGAGAMKTLLRAVGRELGRLFPRAQTLVVSRWRDTAGYAGRENGGPKSVDKVMEYDMALFRR
jgi:hypothetical protein